MLLTEEFCGVCKKETQYHNGICSECSQREETAKRQRYFSELSELTIEQRLRKIEEWIYEHKNSHLNLIGNI